jgi:regulator of sigma D
MDHHGHGGYIFSRAVAPAALHINSISALTKFSLWLCSHFSCGHFKMYDYGHLKFRGNKLS